jgi:hypothetical protein
VIKVPSLRTLVPSPSDREVRVPGPRRGDQKGQSPGSWNGFVAGYDVFVVLEKTSFEHEH